MQARSLLVLLAVNALALAGAQASTTTTPETSVAIDWSDFNLRRGVYEWATGDTLGALEYLESGPSTGRAALLRAEAERRLGNRYDALRRQADQGEGFDAWIAYAQLLEHHRQLGTSDAPVPMAPANFADADFLSAVLRFERGDHAGARQQLESSAEGPWKAMRLQLRAQIAEAEGDDAWTWWRKLADHEPGAQGDRRLVDAARLRAAAYADDHQEDPAQWLELVEAASPLYARAQHMLGLVEVSAGNEAGLERLRAVAMSHPNYDGRADLLQALGGQALETSQFDDARHLFLQLDDEWSMRATELDRLGERVDLSDVWKQWERSWATDDVAWAHEPSLQLAIDAARDLKQAVPRTNDISTLPAPMPAAGFTAPVQLDDAEIRRDMRLTMERQHNEYLRAREERTLANELERLGRSRRYFQRGADEIDSSLRDLDASVARLDSVLATLEILLADLRAVRDDEIDRIATRGARLLALGTTNANYIRSFMHFYIDGPMGKRLRDLPEGIPHPSEILLEELELSGMIEDFVQVFSDRAPVRVQRSSDEIWEPRLMGAAPALAARAKEQQRWALAMAAAVDSSLAATTSSPQLLASQAALANLAANADSLQQRQNALRDVTLRDAIARTRANMDTRREGIDYGLAAAHYELTVAQTQADVPVASKPTAAAIEHLQRFLERYPDSHARGESRFRLADLLLLQARDEFHGRMANYLAARENGTSGSMAVPFLDYESALDLYRAILAEDTDFPHRDATLFHLGMILSDAVDPQAEEYLQELITSFPDAEFVQRAHLRLADNRFAQKNFVASAQQYEKAAQGDDNEARAIALYKLGWSHFNTDSFDQAAVAFGRLMDLYDADARFDTSVDLRGEARDDLIHALARGGGASAFLEHFDSQGTRDYEKSVLGGISQLMRTFALYDEATASDRLYLQKYATDPSALDAATRLIDTYERGFDKEQANEARLDVAQKFVPNGDWFETNVADSLRAQGLEFARTSYRTVALYEHRQAREEEASAHANWNEALGLYGQLITNWPDHGETPRFHYLAGECARELTDFASALDHYRAAAASDTASFREEAAWASVAVCDTWYETSRPAGEPNAVGADSLATQLIEEGRAFLTKHPADSRGADILWREGNLSFAHGWHDAAETSLHDFVRAYPRDERAPRAARLRADSFYRRARYQDAGSAYEDALLVLRAAGEDSLAAHVTTLIPHSYYKHAESIAASDSTEGLANAAVAFENVAQRWPAFEFSHLALYQAGLGRASAGEAPLAVSDWQRLIDTYPESEYRQDSLRQIALTWEAAGQPLAAARAYERYSTTYPTESDAADALMKAADLLEAGDDPVGAETIRTQYLQQYPDDFETALEIREKRARRDLAQFGASPAGMVALLDPSATVPSELSRYLTLAKQHPDRAAPDILAQVAFLEAEQELARYTQLRLTQPLEQSLQRKRDALDATLQSLGACAQHSVAPWAQAAAYRVGEALVHFGDALVQSERPSDLTGDDRLAYDEVLEEQSWAFYDRGEEAWAQLLREPGSSESDEVRTWLEKTRSSLYPRVARRFAHHPEVSYPLVPATEPENAAR